MRVFLKSYGCAANLADGEVLAGCLRQAGFELAESVKVADVLVYNCCAVKGPTEDRMVEVLKRGPVGKRLVFGVFARGRVRSYSIGEIVERVKTDLGLGAREFWLTSQDDACYGRDVGTNLVGLLEAVCSLQGDFRVRVGMMTPNFVCVMLDGLVDGFRCEKVFKFLHLPVQSGDDEVLRRMRRYYTVQDFKRIVDGFRAVFPWVTLATDVICGFPGETREAFENTLALISEVKPDVVNVSKFFARPGTAAAEMSDVVGQVEIKRRSAEMAKLAKRTALERNECWVGWVGDVLVDEKGKVSGPGGGAEDAP